MKNEYSGNIYKFPLKFDKGYAFAEVLDYPDISDFDGILLQVFNAIDKDKDSKTYSIKDIKATGIKLGPLPVNKYPNIKGKGAWIL